MGSDSISSLNISQVSSFLNNHYQRNKVSQDKPSTTTQLPQIEPDELTSEVLNSMRNYIIEDSDKELMDNKYLLSKVFLSGTNHEELASKFSVNKTNKDEKELILARFAMKFMFDKILDKNDAKMQEVIRIISKNTDLKEALSQVLAGVEDNNQAINRFNEVFKIEAKEDKQNIENIKVKDLTNDFNISSISGNQYWTHTVKVVQKFQVEAHEQADDTSSAYNKASHSQIDTDSIAQLQENRSKLGEVGLFAQEYNRSLDKILAVATKLDNEYGLRTSDRCYRALSLLGYLRQLNGLAGYYVNSQLLGAFSFNHEEAVFYGKANQYAFSKAVEALEKEGMSKEEATEKVREFMEVSLVMDWLLKVYEQVKSRKHEVDEIKYNAEEQINLINQQITFLEARAQAKLTLQETFNKMEISITDFFDKDSVMKAAKLMVAGISFYQSQDFRNLLLISSMLDDIIIASFLKFKQELRKTDVNQNVIEGINVILTVHKKDMFNKASTVKVA